MAINFLRTLKPVESYYCYLNLKIIKKLAHKTFYTRTATFFTEAFWIYIYFDNFVMRLSFGSKYTIV